MRPRPNLAMKLMASGVQNSAARVRSPSFSRSSSSMTTIMRPDFISAMAVGMSTKPSAGLGMVMGLAPGRFGFTVKGNGSRRLPPDGCNRFDCTSMARMQVLFRAGHAESALTLSR